MNTPAGPLAPPQIETRASGDFIEWLARSRGALAVTTYNSGKLAIFSAPTGDLVDGVWRFARPMGVAFENSRLAVATQEHIWVFRGAADQPESLVLEHRYDTGRVDAHDLAFGAKGLYFANTRFNCIARPNERVRFVRTWHAPFVERNVHRDACHLNGLGMRDGRPALVTAFCAAGRPGAWREGDRFTSGVLVDVRGGRVVASGLCMPHSPRWNEGRWWLCNSGEGCLCTFDPQCGACQTVAMLPGFTRGLCFAAGRAVVGLSRIRRRHILDAPPVRARFGRLRSGVALIDTATGRETGRLEFIRGGREVYDVAFLPSFERPTLSFDAADGNS